MKNPTSHRAQPVAAHILPEVTTGDSHRYCGETTCRVHLYDTDGNRFIGEVVAQSHDEARGRAAFIRDACNENAKLHELVNANTIARCDAQDRADKLAVALENLVQSVERGEYIATACEDARAVLQSAKEAQ